MQILTILMRKLNVWIIIVEFILFTLERKVISFLVLRDSRGIGLQNCFKSFSYNYKSIFFNKRCSINFCSCYSISCFYRSSINLIGGVKEFSAFANSIVNETIKDSHSIPPSNEEFVVIELPGGNKIKLSRNFIEWFRGFTDAEGCF